MWKEFSRSYLARNPAAGRTVAAAALAAAFFLSLVIGLFYNLWVYEVARIIREEGGWQARVTVPADGPAPEELLKALTDFANVESAALADPTPEGEAVIELTFRRRGRIYADLALIRQALDLPEEAVQAHELLLSRYLVSDPQDPDPPLLLPFLLAVVGAVALALVLLIRNAFAITMQSRLHQFGILSSVGATPRQLRVCLLQEAAVLALIPLAYVVYSLIGEMFFQKDKKKQGVFLLAMGVIMMSSWYSVYTQGTFLLVRIWQGKAVLASVILPAVFYLCSRLLVLKNSESDWSVLVCAMISGFMVSTMGIMLPVLSVAVFGFLFGLLKKNWGGLIRCILVCMPNLIFAVIYLMIR